MVAAAYDNVHFSHRMSFVV